MEAFSKKTRAARTKVYLLLAIVAVLGICTGFGTYTFTYAQGFSYFSNDPRACMNCHIMREQFDGWQKAPHHAVEVPPPPPNRSPQRLGHCSTTKPLGAISALWRLGG